MHLRLKHSIIKYNSKALTNLSKISNERYIPTSNNRIKYYIDCYQLEIYKELNENDIIRSSLPISLRVLLSSRYDLISEGLHKIENERLLSMGDFAWIQRISLFASR